MTSDGRGGGGGGSAKSDFITKGSLINHLMRGEGGVKKGQKSSDVTYGRPLIKIFTFESLFLFLHHEIIFVTSFLTTKNT